LDRLSVEKHGPQAFSRYPARSVCRGVDRGLEALAWLDEYLGPVR